MVTETTPGADVLDDEDLDLDAGFTTDEDGATDAVDDTVEEQESDPLAELRGALETATSEIERLKTLDPAKIGPALGRVAALQSKVDELEKRNPTAELEPRFETTENLTRAIARALIAGDLVDDASKASLSDILAKDETTRTQRELDRRVKEAVAQAVPQTTQESAPETGWQASPDAEIATRTITKAAKRAGIDPTSLPWQQASAMGSLEEAEDFLFEAIAKPSPAAGRAEERRQAAGTGSPNRSGGASTHQDIVNRYGAGDPSVTAEQYQAAAKALDLI